MSVSENQSKKVKVLEVVPCLGVGGAERLVLDICKNLNRDEFEVKIVSLYAESHTAGIYKDSEKKLGIPVIYLDKKEGFDLSLIKQLKGIYKTEKPDVIHTHLYSVTYSIFAARYAGAPIMLHTVHNMALKELPGLHRKILRRSYRKGRVVPVAISGIVKQSIAEAYRLGQDKIPCVYNGIDTGVFDKKTDYTGGDGSVKIINTGRFSPQKNHSLLIDAFKLCCKKHENLRLIIAGDGPLRIAAEEKAEALSLRDKTDFLGVVDDLQTRLKEADIFALSSDYEGLPLSVLEAMSAGLPVAATDAGGTREPVRDGENGFITPVGDPQALAQSILKLASDPALRQQMGKRSALYAQDYDVKKMVSQYEKLYKGQSL